jgi:hypothetical protein
VKAPQYIQDCPPAPQSRVYLKLSKIKEGAFMSTHLQKLIEAAKVRPFPAAEREAQRRSFAYGNTKIENPRITRSTVDQQAEILKSKSK